MTKSLKLVITLLILISFLEVKAQISLGAGAWYGTDIENVGFSVNGKYEINEKWAIAPAYSYFIKKTNTQWSVLDIDTNYQFTGVGEKGSFYGIGGLNLTFWEYDGPIVSDLKSEAYCFNLGLGLSFDISEKFAIAPEMRYTFGDLDYFRMGVKFMFGL